MENWKLEQVQVSTQGKPHVKTRASQGGLRFRVCGSFDWKVDLKTGSRFGQTIQYDLERTSGDSECQFSQIL